MLSHDELTRLKQSIQRLIIFLKGSDKYQSNQALIDALTPSEAKYLAPQADDELRNEPRSTEELLNGYLHKYFPKTEVKTTVQEQVQELLTEFSQHRQHKTFDALHPDVKRTVVACLRSLEIATEPLFQTRRDIHRLVQLREIIYGVLEGSVERVKQALRTNPRVLFKKASYVIDPSGQRFYDLSAYQLMTFLCDADMKAQIMALVEPCMTEDMRAIQQAQYAEIDCGGADLVRLSWDPATASSFSEILSWIYRSTLSGVSLSIPLLENKDGLIFYNNQFYYANRETETVTQLSVDEKDSKHLQSLFTDMPNNSARRSSDDEHTRITTYLKHPEKSEGLTLSRKGIRYERNGISYRDYRIEFRLPTIYRQYFELVDKALADPKQDPVKWGPVDKFWVEEVNGAQKEVIWLLQRFCEPKPSFDPLPDVATSTFVRSFEIYNWRRNGQVELVFAGGCFRGDFALGLICIHKDCVGADGAGAGDVDHPGVRKQLEEGGYSAVLRLIEDGKAKVVELKAEDLLRRDAPGATP